jgi:hypothetical protein
VDIIDRCAEKISSFIEKEKHMRNKKWIPVLVSVFVAAAIFLSVGAYQAVSAAAFERRGGGFGMGGPANEELAAALGISVDELTAAQQEASEAAIQQAGDAGLITQQQAEQMRSVSRFGMGMHFGSRMLGSSTIDFQALLADALGISVDELTAAQETAHQAHLAQAVAAGTITQEQADLMQARQRLHQNENFQSSMQSAHQAAIAQAVADGTITQEQADQMLSNGFGMGRGGFGGMHGGRGGFGGMRGSGTCLGTPAE